MAFFSVWDWQDGDWRVYRHDGGGGMFDPIVEPAGTDKKLGVMLEDVLSPLPAGARFVGRSQLCLGRAAIDAKARRQALAKLPEGIGSVEGTGGLGAFEMSPTAKTVVTVGLAFAGGLAIAWGLSQWAGGSQAVATANRRRRNPGWVVEASRADQAWPRRRRFSSRKTAERHADRMAALGFEVVLDALIANRGRRRNTADSKRS